VPTTESPRQPDDSKIPLALVLTLAVVLRVWGLDFGLPHTLARPDEDATVAIALKFFTRSWNPGFFDWPSFFFYVSTLAFVVYFQIGRLIGWFPYEVTFLVEASRDQSPLRRITRGLSAAAGVVTVAAVHAIGRAMFGAIDGLLGAFFLAAAALHVRDSHFGVTDVAATCLVTLSFLYTVKFASSRRRADLLRSAILAGLAASTKYNAGLVVLPGVLAIVMGPRATESAPREAWTMRIGLAAGYGALAIASFFAGTPYALVDRPAFFKALESITAHLRGGHAAMAGPGWLVHLTSSLRYGMGLPVLIAGIAGLLLAMWRDWRSGLLLATFPVSYYAFIGAGETAFARYIIPVIPFLCLAAGHTISRVADSLARLAKRPQAAPAVAWVVAALAAAPSLVRAVQSDMLLSQTDNRLIAAQWVRDKYPEGVSIAQTGTVAGQIQMTTAAPREIADKYVPLKFEPASLRFFNPADQDGGLPDLILVEECPLAYCEVPEQWRKVIRDRYELDRAFPAFDASSTELVYDRDDDFYLPLAGLSDVTRPGPNITVYRRRADAKD
jgi:4-amino-4-deoxy-L-arabinose transferase-like glycosyltransferase